MRESDYSMRTGRVYRQISPGVTLRFLCDGCNKSRSQFGRRQIVHRGAKQWRCAECLKPKEQA